MSKAYKKLSSHGNITIPVAIRREIGMEPQDPVVVEVTGDNRLIISPYLPRCIFCGGQEGIRLYHNKGICPSCQHNLKEV